MCWEQNPESKDEMVWACWAEGRERLGEEMQKGECDQNGGQRCSKKIVELCGEGREGYGYKGGMA